MAIFLHAQDTSYFKGGLRHSICGHLLLYRKAVSHLPYFYSTTKTGKRFFRRRAFTLIELLIVVAIIAVLAAIVFFSVGGNIKKTKFVRAKAELAQISQALNQYIIENKGALPPDADRSVPPGIESYLGPGIWPNGPWEGSVYDWDVYPDRISGPNYQVSIRFCPLGKPADCHFPDEPWAANFDYYSSVYFCVQGNCKAHPDQPQDHAGYCINCQ
ncbi:MAG: hypothetical protein JWM56_256 [Candidatus Peribacteria bacterium]|nr:hypothetical protein [Candidatus Peribacteria bacterium]